MPKSLVTGGAGFIGSNIVDQLLDIGHQVIVIDNEHSDVHDHFYWNDQTENYRMDIRDTESIRPLFDGVNYVFHTAAEARIQPAIENPVEAVSINSVGTCNVLQCAREAGVDKVVYSSTAAAYGLNEPPNDEEQPNDCLNPYSVSKVNGEELCQMYTNLFGLKTVILRYFNAYGNRSHIRGQYVPVIGIFLRQLAAGEALTIVGDGEQRRDFVNVLDIASANILAAIKNLPDENYGQIYNIGTGINYSVNEIANMISDNVVYVPPRIGEARITLANNQKMKNVFDWEPEIDVKDWIMGVLK